MRFSIVTILGLAALATAQSSAATNGTTASAVSSSISRAASATVTSLSPQQTCLAACAAADICCQARCVNVPCPSALQANATTECAMRCPQGDGSRSDTDKYAACQASCVSSYFFSTGTAGATGTRTGSGAAATGTGSGASASGSGTASATGASATQNAASEIRFGAAGAGLVGLIIAGLVM